MVALVEERGQCISPASDARVSTSVITFGQKAHHSSLLSTSGLRRKRRSRHSAAFLRTMGRTVPVTSRRCTSAASDSANSLPPTERSTRDRAGQRQAQKCPAGVSRHPL